MRRTLAISATPTTDGAEPEIRLFTMNDGQATLFEEIVVQIARSSGLPFSQASAYVEKTVISMLGGKMPPPNSQKQFHDLRIRFPILTSKQIRRLPRSGCPSGRLTSMILTLGFKGGGSKNIRLDLDQDQADFYNDAILQIRDNDGCTKDEAWQFVTKMIGRLVGGAEVVKEQADFMVLRASGLFPGLTEEEALELPEATEDDFRRWSFTNDRSRLRMVDQNDE